MPQFLQATFVSFVNQNTGTALYALCRNSTNTGYEWQALPSANPGTVTSISFSTGTTGLAVSGSPITSSGTFTLSGTLNVANGGTGDVSFAANNTMLMSGTTATGPLALCSGWTCDSIGQMTGLAQGVADVPLTLVTATSPTVSDYLLAFKQNATAIGGVLNSGGHVLAPAASASGLPNTMLSLTPAGDTSITTGTESSSIIYNGAVRQWNGSTTLSLQRSWQINADTIGAVTTTTVTTASTLDIAGPPVAGSHVTITNPYSLQVASGNSYFGGNLTTPSGSYNITAISSNGTTALAINLTNYYTCYPYFVTVANSANNAGYVAYNTATNAGTSTGAMTYFAAGGNVFQSLAAVTNVTVQGATSQTGDLTRWQNSSFGTLAKIDGNGAFYVTPQARTSGNNQTLTITPPGDTYITAGANSPNLLINGASRQWATGSVAATYSTSYGQDTLSAVAASTFATASTVYIAGPPVAGTHATLTNAWSLLVASGNSSFAGPVYSGGGVVTSNNIYSGGSYLFLGVTAAGSSTGVELFGGNNLLYVLDTTGSVYQGVQCGGLNTEGGTVIAGSATFSGNVSIGGEIEISNSSSASVGVGAITGKFPIYNASGVLLGYSPIYSSIT